MFSPGVAVTMFSTALSRSALWRAVRESCVSQYRPASVSECCVEDQAMLDHGLA